MSDGRYGERFPLTLVGVNNGPERFLPQTSAAAGVPQTPSVVSLTANALAFRYSPDTTSDSSRSSGSDDEPLPAIRYVPRSLQGTSTKSGSSGGRRDSCRKDQIPTERQKHKKTVFRTESFDAYEDDEGDDDNDNTNKISNKYSYSNNNNSNNNRYEWQGQQQRESYYGMWGGIDSTRMLSLRSGVWISRDKCDNTAVPANKQKHTLLSTVNNGRAKHTQEHNHHVKGVQLASSSPVQDRAGLWHRIISLFVTDRNEKKGGARGVWRCNEDVPVDLMCRSSGSTRNNGFTALQGAESDKLLSWSRSNIRSSGSNDDEDLKNSNVNSTSSNVKKNGCQSLQFTGDKYHPTMPMPKDLSCHSDLNAQKSLLMPQEERQRHYSLGGHDAVLSFEPGRDMGEYIPVSSSLYEPHDPRITSTICNSTEVDSHDLFVVKSKPQTSLSVSVTENMEEDHHHHDTSSFTNYKQYIRDIVHMLFVPGSIEAEERDVRRWIRSVNHLRRRGALWVDAEDNASPADHPDQTALNESNTADIVGGVENVPERCGAGIGSLPSDPVVGAPQRKAASSTTKPTFLDISHANGHGDHREGVESLHLCQWCTPSMQAYAMGMHSSTSPTLHGRTGTRSGGTSHRSNNHSRSNSSLLGVAAVNTWKDSCSSPFQEEEEEEELSCGNVSGEVGNATQHCKQRQKRGDMRDGDGDYAADESRGSGDEIKHTNHSSENDKDGNSSGSKLASYIPIIKQHLVLLATFMPLTLFVGLSVFTSAVAISGLFIFVVTLLLSVLVYWHVVKLYSLCFSVDLWPFSSPQRTRGNTNDNHNSHTNDDVGYNGSWLLLSPSLLELTQRIGGMSLYIMGAVLYMCALLSAAVLSLSFGFTLTGGAVAAINVLWEDSALDTAAVLKSPKGCIFGQGLRFVTLFLLLALALCIAGPAKGRNRFCWWWETGIFRLTSLAVFGLLFLTTLAVQVQWTLQHSPSKFDIPLSFIVEHTWNRDVPSMSWLQDTLSFADYWMEWKGLAYIVLRLSLSLAQLAWLFACGASFIRAGTYHLYLLPLLWKRGATNAQLRKEREEYYGSSSGFFRNGVFMATGFGASFRLAFVLFLSMTLIFTFTAFVGTNMSMPSLAAPLPLRLLWIAVPHNVTIQNGDSEQLAVCSLGIMEGLGVGTLRFVALLSFITGVMFFAWVPYFVVHVSGMLANLRPGAQLEERQALAVSAFLRSKRAAAHRHSFSGSEESLPHIVSDTTSTSLDCNSGDIIARDDEDRNKRNSFSRWLSPPRWLCLFVSRSTGNDELPPCGSENDSTMNRSSKTNNPDKKIIKLGSVVFDLSSPFIIHPEQYYATTRSGDGIRVLELFKHLRRMTLEGNWLRYHVMEVLLLRLPFLFLIMMVTALLVAGGDARCYGFWTFWKTKPASTEQLPWDMVVNRGNSRSPHCSQFVSVIISDELYGQIVLFSAMTGGFFLTPLVFALPVLLLLRCWWERRRCLRLNASVARVMRVDSHNVNDVSAMRQRDHNLADMAVPFLSDTPLPLSSSSHTTTRTPNGRKIGGDGVTVDVPVLTETSSERLLPPEAVRGGLAGVRFFVAMQQSEEAVGVIERIIRCGVKRAAETSSIAEKMGRYRYPTYNAPLAPSQYYHHKGTQRETSRGGKISPSMICKKCWILLQSGLSVMVEAFSILVALLAFVGGLRASAALADQYGFWTS